MPALAASNPRIRRLRRLSGRRGARTDEAAFLIEGPVIVAEALTGGADLEAVFAETSMVDNPVVDLARRRGVEVHEVADGVLTGITDAVAPRPILAVATLVARDLDALADDAVSRSRPLVVLVDVRDPGNLGTILRAAEAAGVAGVVCTKGTVDPWSPKAVRSSAGAILHVPVAAGLPADDVLGRLGRRGILRVGTAVDGGAPYDRTVLSGAVALVLGSEAHGLDASLAAALDVAVTIPMEGRAESLNVAMAASVLCFEALRQRRAAGSDGVDRVAEPIGRLDRPATR